VPYMEPARPGPGPASLSASRRRRAEAARQARRRRAGRGGGAALLAAMTLAAGGAVAQDGPATTKSATTGSTVVALQRALGVSADGVIGPITRRAIRNYQRNHGLVVDGVAGPATLGSLGITASSAPAKTQTTQTQSTGSGRSATLAKIAQCESGGNPTAVSSTGRYRGKYQFSRATWRDLGGSGDPAAAPESVQDAMAAKLYAQRGAQPWPVCG
jgi:peptidoglycan hydrolase-like protein with peptidoglycan-binding domain